MAIDASQLLGSRQVAGVRVNPWGAFRKAEASATTISGGIVVPGRLGVAIGDAAGGKAGAEERRGGRSWRQSRRRSATSGSWR